jgi:hypothetical protein
MHVTGYLKAHPDDSRAECGQQKEEPDYPQRDRFSHNLIFLPQNFISL